MNYREAIDWLFSTQTFGIKLGLDGTRQLLKEYLAFPEHTTRVIHIAGTNGKGSTCAMVDSLIRSSGNRCGLFTSPHLIDFRERIQVSGGQITEEACATMLTELKDICESFEHHPTFFEIALVLAMRWFRQQQCEFIVLETGMGGRLDATTAVPADVTAITPIGLDHTEWLGDTIEKIAAEKAGIFVEGKPALSSPQEPAAARVLEKEANEKRAPLTFIDNPLQGYSIGLAGEHQQWNAALAVASVHAVGCALNPDIVRHALGNMSWPGRFEEIQPKLILDGAHNPQGAKALVDTWKHQFPDHKPTLIFSSVSGKDIAGALEIIAPIAKRILLCPIDTPRAITTNVIASLLPASASEHESFDSLEAALRAAKRHDDPILISGSLFLIGEARALLTRREFQPSVQ